MSVATMNRADWLRLLKADGPTDVAEDVELDRRAASKSGSATAGSRRSERSRVRRVPRWGSRRSYPFGIDALLAYLRRSGDRLVLFAVGVVLLVVGLVTRDTTVLFAGLFCCVAALLINRVRIFELGLPGGGNLKAETRTEDEVAASAVAAEEPSAERETVAVVVDEEERQRADARHLVASAAVDTLLHPQDGPLADCEFRLFRYMEDRGRLLPVLDPERDPHLSEGWAPGQGATGAAWDRAEYVRAEGGVCSDATYGLTASQRERYKNLAAVAAAPVLNAAGEVIAVLSASTENPESGLATEEGQEAHLALAGAMGRVLVDLLRWSEDG